MEKRVSEANWKKLKALDTKLVGTTDHSDRWPRRIWVRVSEGGTEAHLVRLDAPDERPMPALTADEVERLIHALGKARARMMPKVPVREPQEVPVTVSSQTKVRIAELAGLTVLRLRTDHFGWQAAFLSPTEAARLRRDLGDEATVPMPAGSRAASRATAWPERSPPRRKR